MPSAAMPPSRYRPDTPAPVPTSTTVRAPAAAASTRSVAPPAGPIGVQPSSRARSRAANSTSSSGTNDSSYDRLAELSIASTTGTTLAAGGPGSAHRIEQQLQIARCRERVDDRETRAHLVGVLRGGDEADLVDEQPAAPAGVI